MCISLNIVTLLGYVESTWILVCLVHHFVLQTSGEVQSNNSFASPVSYLNLNLFHPDWLSVSLPPHSLPLSPLTLSLSSLSLSLSLTGCLSVSLSPSLSLSLSLSRQCVHRLHECEHQQADPGPQPEQRGDPPDHHTEVKTRGGSGVRGQIS